MIRALWVALGGLTLGLLAAACGSGGSGESQGISIIIAGAPAATSSNNNVPGNSVPQANVPQPANPQAQTGTEILDIAFTGALQGAWRTGDRSAGVTCTVFGNNQLNVSMFGTINNANYALGVDQDSFAPNAYTFPLAAAPTAPSVQITTPSNANQQWDLSGPRGKGSLTIAGNATSQVGGSIDADLADKNGGGAVHVRGSFTCRIGGR